MGRETSPVKFDTQRFQKKLAAIAGQIDNDKVRQKKIELKFYDVLEQPEPVATAEPAPGTDRALNPGNRLIPVKTSMKKKTYKKQAHPVAVAQAEDKNYTIQVAAYRNVKDAEIQMGMLEKRGFTGYKVKGMKKGVVWYRVRFGAFKTFGAAAEMQKKLEKAGIMDTRIIKKGKK